MVAGMAITAEIPSRRAAKATPWAWLPPLTATTPRLRSAGDSDSILLKAARLERSRLLQQFQFQEDFRPR